MRRSIVPSPEFIPLFVLLGLAFCPCVSAHAQTSQSAAQSATQAACSAASQNGSAQNNSVISAEAQNVQNAAKQLGSLFKKKPASTPAASANPCPAAGAPPANASANAPAPAATATAPAGGSTPAAAPAANSPQPASAAPAPASTLGGVQLPPAPPGGLDPSKLPDIVSIHIGTPTDKVIAQLNSLYPVVRNDRNSQIWGPGGNTGIGTASLKYAPTNDPPYVASAMYARPFPDPCPSSPNGCQSSDEIRAIFSGPPEKVLVRLERTASYGSGSPTATSNLKAALAQKYGPNFTEDPPMTLNWAFDEQGKALPAPPKPVSCRGIISQQGNLIPLASYLGLIYTGTPPPLQQQLTPILRGRCSYILVQARINGQPNGPANQLTVIIQELPEDLRDAFAAETYMQQAANAQSNQQLKNAQQQAAPKF